MSSIHRRQLLAVGGLLTAGVAVGQGLPVRVRGPAIYRDMDQADLDDAFDVAKVSPNLPLVVKRWMVNSDIARTRLGEPKRLSYGPAAIETLDLYPTSRPNAPINVFIHGGAFSMGSARAYAFPAELFVRSGAHLVIPDFGRAGDFGGSPLPLVDQVRRAVAWVQRNARSFGGDPDRIYVTGHSSGAELAGLVAVTDWPGAFQLPRDTVKGALCCSGTYDLKVLRLSAGGASLKIDDAVEEAMSVERQMDRLGAPMIVACGSLETAWFQRRTREFAAAASAAGKPVRLLTIEGYNHFEVIETLANPYGALGRAVLEQMGLQVG